MVAVKSGRSEKETRRGAGMSGCTAEPEENQRQEGEGSLSRLRPPPTAVTRPSAESLCVEAEGMFSLHHVSPLGFHSGNARSSIRPAPASPLSVICPGGPPEVPPLLPPASPYSPE